MGYVRFLLSSSSFLEVTIEGILVAPNLPRSLWPSLIAQHLPFDPPFKAYSPNLAIVTLLLTNSGSIEDKEISWMIAKIIIQQKQYLNEKKILDSRRKRGDV